jgi:glycosyltransferase involved in cell wall biosynthesis
MERLLPLLYRKTPFLTISQSTQADLVKRGIDPARITVVHSGVDHQRFRPRRGARASRPTILYLGRVRRYKGIDLLFHATRALADEIEDLQLWIAGDGRDLPRLRREAARLGVAGRVTFFGRLSDTQKVALLQQATVVAQPSSKEGWGLTVLEANACGTPVVASAVPGLRESVRPGETGLLAPPGDVTTWVTQLRRLLTDQALHTQMGTAAKQWAAQFFWDTTATTVALRCQDVSGSGRVENYRD